MTYEFRVSMVATQEQYEADGTVVVPGTVWPADPNVPLSNGWAYQVDRVDPDAKPAEDEASKDDEAVTEPEPSVKPHSEPIPPRSGRRAP